MPSTNQQQTLTPLEQDVLDEYRVLLDNMNRLSGTIATITNQPTADILDSLRLLERKTGLVCTLMKASVYSIVLAQEMHEQDMSLKDSNQSSADDISHDEVRMMGSTARRAASETGRSEKSEGY